MTGVHAYRNNSWDIAPVVKGRCGGGQPTVSVRVSHVASGLDRFCGLPVPRQQLVESIDRMSIDQALEHVAQVGVGFDAVHLGSFNQRTQRRPSRSTIIRARKKMILAAECNGTNRALNGIGVELDAAIMQEPGEPISARQRIADRVGELAAARRAAELLLEPDLQLFDKRFGERPPLGHSERGGQAADARLDGTEFANSPQHLSRNRRAICLEEFVEVAPRMRPTSGQDDVASGLQPLEPGVAIDVEDSRELLQMRRRTLALAIRRKHKDGCRRSGSAPRSLVTRVHPKPSSLGAAATGIEHRDRRIVGKQMIRRKDIRAELFVQSVEPPACTANPSGQRRAIELNTVTREDLRLPVQRRVVAIFADQDLGEQRWRRQPTCDRALRRRRLTHRSAGAAAVFGAADANDAELRRHPINISLTLSPIGCSAPPQHVQASVPTSIRTSSRGK